MSRPRRRCTDWDFLLRLSKVLAVNRSTGIDFRSAIIDVSSEVIDGPRAPEIGQLSDLFLKEGVALSTLACKKAIKEWGGSASEITHMVSTTCTHSANPGYDQFVAKNLGLGSDVAKVLLHGVGCSGGLAALRTASTLALGETCQGRPARILVLACELTSPLLRCELDLINRNQETRIGACLFSDCASSMVLGNGLGKTSESSSPIFELMGSITRVIPETSGDLGFDVDTLGWKVVLSQRIPELVASALPSLWADLMKPLVKVPPTTDGTKINGFKVNGTAPNGVTNGVRSDTSEELPIGKRPTLPSDFDWALHPGGLTIITSVEEAMKLQPEDLRASYEIYINHGNSSSATVISVLDRLRSMGLGREYVTSCAVGPGISVEMMLLKRLKGVGNHLQDNSKTESINDKQEGANGIKVAGEHAVLRNGKVENSDGQGQKMRPSLNPDGPVLVQQADHERELIRGSVLTDVTNPSPKKRKHCKNDVVEESNNHRRGADLQNLPGAH